MFDVKSAFVIAIVNMIILYWTLDMEKKKINEKRKRTKNYDEESARRGYFAIYRHRKKCNTSCISLKLSADINLKMEIRREQRELK